MRSAYARHPQEASGGGLGLQGPAGALEVGATHGAALYACTLLGGDWGPNWGRGQQQGGKEGVGGGACSIAHNRPAGDARAHLGGGAA